LFEFRGEGRQRILMHFLRERELPAGGPAQRDQHQKHGEHEITETKDSRRFADAPHLDQHKIGGNFECKQCKRQHKRGEHAQPLPRPRNEGRPAA